MPTQLTSRDGHLELTNNEGDTTALIVRYDEGDVDLIQSRAPRKPAEFDEWSQHLLSALYSERECGNTDDHLFLVGKTWLADIDDYTVTKMSPADQKVLAAAAKEQRQKAIAEVFVEKDEEVHTQPEEPTEVEATESSEVQSEEPTEPSERSWTMKKVQALSVDELACAPLDDLLNIILDLRAEAKAKPKRTSTSKAVKLACFEGLNPRQRRQLIDKDLACLIDHLASKATRLSKDLDKANELFLVREELRQARADFAVKRTEFEAAQQ